MAEDLEDISTPLLLGTQASPVHSVLSFLGKVVFSALPIASIVIGAMYLGQCPWQVLLPYYLMVGGSAQLLLLLLTCLPCGDGTESDQLSTAARGWRAVFLLFLFAWFIAGNVWVYSTYTLQHENPSQKDFCPRLLYLFAFWVTTLVYIGLGVALLVALCVLACLLLLRSRLPWLRHGVSEP